VLAAADEAPALNRGARRRACANVSGRQCSGRGDSQDVRRHLRRELSLVFGTEEAFTGSQHMPSRGDSRFRGHHGVDQEGPDSLPKAWRETQHSCAALVQSRHPQNLADG
jgi:hypothetical protein